MLRGNRQKDLLQPWLRARIVLNTEGRLVLLEGLEDLREAVAVRWDSELDDLPMVVGYLRAREEAHDLGLGGLDVGGALERRRIGDRAVGCARAVVLPPFLGDANFEAKLVAEARLKVLLAADAARWAEVIQRANIRVE
jgi:hypothetical protein